MLHVERRESSGVMTGTTARPASTESKHPFRDAVVGAVIAVLLSAGVMGELSGAPTPEAALLPVHAEMLGSLGESSDCAVIEAMLDHGGFTMSQQDQAFKDGLEALRKRAQCGR